MLTGQFLLYKPVSRSNVHLSALWNLISRVINIFPISCTDLRYVRTQLQYRLIMKVCSLKRLLKYSILISITSLITTLVYHAVRTNNRRARSIQYEDNVLSDGSNSGQIADEPINWHDYELINYESGRKGANYLRLKYKSIIFNHHYAFVCNISRKRRTRY